MTIKKFMRVREHEEHHTEAMHFFETSACGSECSEGSIEKIERERERERERDAEGETRFVDLLCFLYSLSKSSKSK